MSFIKSKIISFLKKNGISFFIVFIATFLQTYWAMGRLSDNTSSGCLDCSFFEDAFFISLLIGFFLSILFSIFSLLKNLYLKIVIEFILLVALWLFWNYTIFVERESSWSTYLFKEEIYITILQSILPVIILGCISIILLHFKEIKTKLAIFKSLK
ncbi:hypothetical protein A0O34_03520 [Chryseobacterium glaciei]|uniref:Uncharacterized protein n=1 Tax=Chryseobacterium glaciei TaxID=1685010 RepID=A0A172Y1X7_9FLAO|nr:hypothetical protein A0O34_03520 [Chryseobacterium glaciei]